MSGYLIDGREVDPANFYAAACDPARSVVVEACAGAGKTWMLVSRMLRALIDGAAPRQIVAITFTRKAAAEMRERLDLWMAEFAAATPEGAVQALRERGLDAERAAQFAPRLQALQAELLERGEPVEVHTFHAWFAQLLRAAPVALLQQLGLAPELRLIEDESELAQALGRRFRTRVRRDPELQAAYLELARHHGPRKLGDWLQAALDKRVELARGESALLNSMPPPAGWDQDPIADWPRIRKALPDLARELGRGKAKAQDAASGLVDALAIADAEESLAATLKALFTKDGKPRKLGEIEGLDETGEELEAMLTARKQWQAHLDHQRLARLSRVQAEEFAALKRERGCVDMGDLEQGACALLADPVHAGWLQQQLDLQVRQLLIDEFQDTSPLQWQALQAWLSAYAGAGGGQGLSLFIVGDPKQSIYRFRRAEPRVFAAAAEFLVRGLGGQHLSCDHSRRNAPAVRDAVNAVFSRLTAAQAYEGFRAHSGSSEEPGGVWRLDDPEDTKTAAQDEDEKGAWRPSLTRGRIEAEEARKAAEGRRVAALVQDLIVRESLKGEAIMVLARRRSALAAVAEALRARGIAHETPESQVLAEQPEVQDLLALLDLLASPAHNLALARVLRSALFDVDEAGLLRLHEAAQGGSWLAALLALPEPGDLKRAQDLLGRWVRELRHQPAFEALQRVLVEGEFKARFAARLSPALIGPRWAAIDALLDQALNLDGGRYWSLYGFVRALRQRAIELPLRAQGRGVQLLTIHGAKGLEADTVILVDADAAAARAQSSTLLIDWPVGRDGPETLAFLASESKPPPRLETAMAHELEQRRREDLNGLYVALTRARRRFIVSRTAPRRAAGAIPNAWALLQELPDWPLPLPDAQGAAPLQRPALAVLPAPPQELPPIPTRSDTAAADPRAASLGEALHRVMEWATQHGADRRQLPQWQAAAAQMYALDARAQQDLERWLQGLLSSAELAPWLDPARLLWCGNEVAMVWQGQDQRLDRLVCRRAEDGAREWWVLDYKLHPAPLKEPEYLAQMQRYVESVQAMEPADRVRGAFISADGRLHAWPG